MLQSDASSGIRTTGNRDITVGAIEACTQQPTTEERRGTGSQNTREFQMLASRCHLQFEITEDNTAETSSSKCPPQPLLDRRVKKQVRISNQQVFITSGQRLSGAQILAAPAATLNKLCSTADTQLSPWRDAPTLG